MEHYKKYAGQFVKRFYAPFDEGRIWKISGYREVTYFEDGKPLKPREEFLYRRGHEEFWTDCEDSCIITNETPMLEIEWVANVNHPEYKGYDPFSETIK